MHQICFLSYCRHLLKVQALTVHHYSTPFSRSLQHFEIFKFWPKRFSEPYLLNQITDSGQTSRIVTLGWFKDLIRVWWPWHNFQGHHTIKTVKMSLVCPLSPESIGGFFIKLAQKHHSDVWKKWLYVGDIDLIFKVTPASFDQKSLSVLYLLNQMIDSDQT